jgi:hypothetical protein
MRIEHFRYLINNEVDGFYLIKDKVMMFRKPIEIWNEKTNESVIFKTIDEALEHVIDGETVKDIILRTDELYLPPLEGGRGAGSGNMQTFTFSNAGSESNNFKALFPAYANTKIKNKTPEGALDEFKKRHGLAKKEWLFEVDEQGYVHQYVEGGKHSVGYSPNGRRGRTKNTMIIHNHPSGGAFSDADLINTANNKRNKGIIASGSKYDYKFEKGTHFNASGFTKAVKKAEMKGKDYDDAVDKWLSKNQKKYGYKYSRKKN